MTTELSSIRNGVNLLSLRDIRLTDLDEVTAWLYALDFPVSDYYVVCNLALSNHEFSFSNVEHRVTVVID